jgi:hypothetical protein
MKKFSFRHHPLFLTIITLSLILLNVSCGPDATQDGQSNPTGDQSEQQHDSDKTRKLPSPQPLPPPSPQPPVPPQHSTFSQPSGYTQYATTADAVKNYSSAAGFANLGNTCFANSVNKLLWADSRFSDPSKAITPAQKLYFTLLNKLDQNWKKALADPTTVQISGDHFATDLNLFYDELEKENIKNTSIPDIDFGADSRIRHNQVDANAYLNNLNVVLELDQLVNGFHVSSQLEFINDKHKSAYNHPPQQLSIELPIDSTHVNSIQNAITAFLLPERMDDPHNLPRRDDNLKFEPADKYSELTIKSNPPSRMILTLKRNKRENDGSTQKLSKYVETNANLTFDFYSQANPSVLTHQKTYNFKGVAIHHGSIQGGHYFAYIREGQTWFKHDDSRIAPVDLKTVENDINTNGYIFLYEE